MKPQPAFLDSDSHLADLFREAERKRKPWWKRINWGPLAGAVIAITVSAGVWTVVIYSILYVKGWLRP